VIEGHGAAAWHGRALAVSDGVLEFDPLLIDIHVALEPGKPNVSKRTAFCLIDGGIAGVCVLERKRHI